MAEKENFDKIDTLINAINEVKRITIEEELNETEVLAVFGYILKDFSKSNLARFKRVILNCIKT